MKDLIKLYRDPDPANATAAAGVIDAPVDTGLSEDSITAALNNEVTTREAGSIDNPADAPKAKETPKVEASADDPEFEIAFKDGKRKVKQSELLDAYEKSKDYTQKMQRISETEKTHKDVFSFLNGIKAHPKLTQLVLKVIQGAVPSPEKGYDDAFIDNALGMFEKQNTKVEETQTQVDFKIDELEAKLKDLDPESPLATTIKSTITQLKGLYGKLESQSKALEKYGKDLAQVQGTIKSQTDAQAKAEETKTVERAGNILTEQLTAMTDSEKHKETAFAFDTPLEAKRFRKDVIQILMAGAKTYPTDNDFANAIREAGKIAFQGIKEDRDALLAKYLKAPTKPTVTTTVPKKDSEQTPPVDETTLEGALSAALETTGGRRANRPKK